jgi:hypothetical protein
VRLSINTEDVALSPKFPTLPTLAIGKYAVVLESISGHGAARATFTLKQMTPSGRVSREWDAGSVTRTDMTTFALNLLDIADQMMHDEAYSRSSALNPTEEARAILARRKKDATQRYFRITERLPILLMAQRVIERCNDDVAQSLLMLLGHAEARGVLPLKVALQVDAVDAPAADGGGRRH